MQPHLYWVLPVPIAPQHLSSQAPVYIPPPLPPSYLLHNQPPPLLQFQHSYPLPNLPLPPQPVRQRRHFKRRCETELNKCHKCPYPNCHKEYASDLALNLHMKNKHRGGNKKQRDRAAKMILLSEMQGRPAPKCNVDLPPGYIEANKIRLLLLETQDENELYVKTE